MKAKEATTTSMVCHRQLSLVIIKGCYTKTMAVQWEILCQMVQVVEQEVGTISPHESFGNTIRK